MSRFPGVRAESAIDQRPAPIASGGRGDRLASLIADLDLAAIVASSYESLCYFAGTDIRSQLAIPDRLAFLILDRSCRPALLVCNIEESQVRTQTPVADVSTYVEFEDDPAAALAWALADAGITNGRLGVEASRLPLAVARSLTEELPGLELVGVDRELATLVAAKNDTEVERLGRLACDLLSALDATLDALDLDSSEARCASELFSRVSAIGGTPMFVFFAAGERTLLGHPEAERTALREGALWRTDFGTRLPGGICGDVARTGVVGAASAIQKEIFAVVRAAQEAAAAIAEPGRPARELFHACKREFERGRLPFLVPHVGHGIGVGIHEPPMLQPGNDTPLAEGTVLMIEPFAILADRAEGYHTEDMVMVSAEGPRRLTVPQDDLMVLV
jgi:Xaa-Pro aminopeptidase